MFESIEYIHFLVNKKEKKEKYVKKFKSIFETTTIKILMEYKRLDLTLAVSIFPFKWHRHDIGCVWKKMS